MRKTLIGILLLALCSCGNAQRNDNVVVRTASYEVVRLNDSTFLAVPINSGEQCQIFNLKQ